MSIQKRIKVTTSPMGHREDLKNARSGFIDEEGRSEDPTLTLSKVEPSGCPWFTITGERTKINALARNLRTMKGIEVEDLGIVEETEATVPALALVQTSAHPKLRHRPEHDTAQAPAGT